VLQEIKWAPASPHSRTRAHVLLRPRVARAALWHTDASHPSLWTHALWTLRLTVGHAPRPGKRTDGPCASRCAVLVTCALPCALCPCCKVAGHASWSRLRIGVPGHHISCPSPSFANRAEPMVPCPPRHRQLPPPPELFPRLDTTASEVVKHPRAIPSTP
jgi:hypothetical protein